MGINKPKGLQQNKEAYFLIADHLVRITYQREFDVIDMLHNFVPFKVDIGDNYSPVVLTIELSGDPVPISNNDLKLLSDISIWEDLNFSFEEGKDHYITTMQHVDEQSIWKMISHKDFRHSVIYTRAEAQTSNAKYSWLIMMAYAQAVLLHQTILIHASVIERKGVGYAFLGKSGTGKSTHSRLWLAHIEDTQLLNDDNPAIRLSESGEVQVYGTPWSGKTKCYKNVKASLGALVRLEQGPANAFHLKVGRGAFFTLLPSVSALRWNPVLFDSMLKTLEVISTTTRVGVLHCLPDSEAAVLCCQKVSETLDSKF